MQDMTQPGEEPAQADQETRSADPAAAPLDGAPAPAGDTAEQRETWPAIWRGYRGRCPNCGSGPLLRSYLKVRDHCPVCREELYHNRADDGPAYLTILIVGHIMAPALHIVFTTWRPEPLTLITIFSVGCIGLSLYLLPRLKGAIVGFQWARRMHGF
ncbi:DUF983 domain-containing protein [Salipiger bermudensis]|uniref:DUF983 domain-containing protein n=1 Tax=Salipiger bermudensis TaxID=344736 RepID=UPI001C9931AD|nr:DUF983 domain-containing protein [Salipiger bermudensis]MBY6004597.1 DUF983 domain-containing protein [Salipiger bermudensis]